MATQEWGRLNSGQNYNLTALDIDRAIAFAKLGFYEDILFQQARELSWHAAVKKKGRGQVYPEPIPARLNIYVLAKSLHLPERRLREGKADLIKSRMFIQADDQRDVWINKRADEWLNPKTNEPRLRPEWVQFCLQAQPSYPCSGEQGTPALESRGPLLWRAGYPCSGEQGSL